MSLRRFDWDDSSVEHIARHRVTPDEVEEAFAGRALRARTWGGRHVLLGRSAAGRYLLVAFALRHDAVRVITARDMTAAERGRYRRGV